MAVVLMPGAPPNSESNLLNLLNLPNFHTALPHLTGQLLAVITAQRTNWDTANGNPQHNYHLTHKLANWIAILLASSSGGRTT